MCWRRARPAATRTPIRSSRPGRPTPAALFTFSDAVLGPRSAGPPLHVHYETDECIYVIGSRLLIQVGEERHELGAGCFAWMSRRIPHTFANASDSPVRGVGIAAPGGLEELFAAQGAYFAQLQGLPDPEQIAAIWAGHSRIVGPPIEVDAAPAASWILADHSGVKPQSMSPSSAFVPSAGVVSRVLKERTRAQRSHYL